MATVRRLSDGDVRTIFECLHQKNQRPPPHLKFKIVPVGPNGLKLSPPSYEFADGLYVLLRPQKKKKNGSSSSATTASIDDYAPRAPSHLLDCVLTDFPPETCPWSLSGPQFPQPTAIQQRYCYPKGDPIYSSRKGGALWTMYGLDGKEDTEYRLLHVYFSAKRAVNKGITIDEEELGWLNSKSSSLSSPSAASVKTPSPNKRYSSKRARTAGVEPSHRHRLLPQQQQHQQHHQQQQQTVMSPPMSTATTTSSFCPSPLSFADHGSCLGISSCREGGSLDDGMDSNFVTPNSSILGANLLHDALATTTTTAGAFHEGRFHPIHSPFRPRILDHRTSATTPSQQSQQQQQTKRKSRLPTHPSPLPLPHKEEDDHDVDEHDDDFALSLPTDHTISSNLEPFPCDMMDDVCLNLDEDVHDDWSPQHSHGGILAPDSHKNHWKGLTSSSSWHIPNHHDFQTHHGHHGSNNSNNTYRQESHQQQQQRQAQADLDECVRAFQQRLADLHLSIRNNILSAQETAQGPLLSILCHWAKQVAQAPLSQPKSATNNSEPHADTTKYVGNNNNNNNNSLLNSSVAATASV